MSLFGLSIVRTSYLKDLENSEVKFQKMVRCRAWFSGWQDLEIIWNYILEDTNFGGIERARHDYARARNTDVYGKDIQ